MKQLEEIIQQYLEKRITSKEAADKSIEKIYKNMSYFGIHDIDEDDRSDFITFFYSKLEQIIQFYNPTKSSFRTYLRGSISSNLMTWKKVKYKLQAKERVVEDYVIDEYTLNIADIENEYVTDQSDCNFEPDNSVQVQIPSEMKKKLNSFCKKLPESTKLMILALKSVNYINQSHIHKLHQLTGIEEKEILDIFLKLQGSLYKKRLLYSQQKEYQNRSYILKKKSMLLLEKTSENSYFYNSLKKAIEFYDKRWKFNTERLKKSRLLTPSCAEIARVLGLEANIVRRIQHFAQEQLSDIQ
jgi:hypothetical protein